MMNILTDVMRGRDLEEDERIASDNKLLDEIVVFWELV